MTHPESPKEGAPTLYPIPDDALGVLTLPGNSHPFDGSEADWQAFKTACAQRAALLSRLQAMEGALRESQGWLQSMRDALVDLPEAMDTNPEEVTAIEAVMSRIRALLTANSKEGAKK